MDLRCIVALALAPLLAACSSPEMGFPVGTGGPGGGRVGILVTVFAAVGAAVALPATGFIAGPIAVALTAAGAAGASL